MEARTAVPRHVLQRCGADALREIAKTESTVPLPVAGQFLGIGENKSYELHRLGQFPVHVLQLGKKLRVPVASLARALEIDLGQIA